MAKLTQEQLDARREKKLLKEEAIKRAHAIESLREDHIPSPSRTFEINELVEFGNHDNAKILDTFDGGKFYRVYAWGVKPEGSRGAGEPTETTILAPWMSLFKLTEVSENLFKRDKFNLSYVQQNLSSLLTKVYGYGVDFDADYQRELVWTDEDKTLLIDSIMESRDIGKFLFMELPFEAGKPADQIVDGKQRLSAICDFYEDRFVWRGKRYFDLSRSDRRNFKDKTVNVAQVNTMPKKDILELFLFVNDTGKPISKEHLDHVKTMLKETNQDT